MAGTLSTPQRPETRAILEFWLGDGLELGWPSGNMDALWWGGGAALDRDIDQRFGALVREAVAGGLKDWETGPADQLALVLLLDQFTRNVFRARPEAFAGDARAQTLVMDSVAKGWDRELPLAGRAFLYMPLVHAEVLALQDKALEYMQALLEDAPPEHQQDLRKSLDSARQHRDIIVRFGRFPHRNAILGRESSAREQEFLLHGPRFGQ